MRIIFAASFRCAFHPHSSLQLLMPMLAHLSPPLYMLLPLPPSLLHFQHCHIYFPFSNTSVFQALLQVSVSLLNHHFFHNSHSSSMYFVLCPLCYLFCPISLTLSLSPCINAYINIVSVPPPQSSLSHHQIFHFIPPSFYPFPLFYNHWISITITFSIAVPLLLSLSSFFLLRPWYASTVILTPTPMILTLQHHHLYLSCCSATTNVSVLSPPLLYHHLQNTHNFSTSTEASEEAPPCVPHKLPYCCHTPLISSMPPTPLCLRHFFLNNV